MKKILLASVMTAAFAVPAFAQSDDMSCADFMKMDADAQMKAVAMMGSDDMKADDMKGDDMAADEMKADDMMADEMMADDGEAMNSKTIVNYCNEHPDMMVKDAMMDAM